MNWNRKLLINIVQTLKAELTLRIKTFKDKMNWDRKLLINIIQTLKNELTLEIRTFKMN